MKRAAAALSLALLTAGCAALNPEPVAKLSDKELVSFEVLEERLGENRDLVEEALESLGDLGAQWSEQEFQLELALAKAKRLDSMKAPWAATRDEFVETQRAVVLYHLYEVEMAEQKVLDARMAARHAAAQEVIAAYDKLVALMSGASANLQVVIEYLNQPKGAQIRAAAETFLGEVSAFRQALAASENPRLQAFAAKIATQEEKVARAKEQADQALNTLTSLQGRGN